MTSDRAYRAGLSTDEALAEIERNIGTQFHPTVAKAFVALQRGQDPFSALTPAEREEVRGASTPYRLADIRGSHRLRERPELIGLAGVICALGGFGLDQLWLVGAGMAVAVTGFALQVWVRRRANLLARALAAALATGERPRVFEALERLLQQKTRSDWVALVQWHEDGLGGEIELARGEGPPEIALMSWLVREAESRDDFLMTGAHELGGAGAYIALPLRRENSALTGFLVLRSPGALQHYVATALNSSLDAIGLALAPQPTAAPPVITSVASAG
jgi:type IV secretory pathway TrbD component